MSFSTATATCQLYTLSLHDALPIFRQHAAQIQVTPSHQQMHRPRGRPLDHRVPARCDHGVGAGLEHPVHERSEEHTSELQSRGHLVCRLLLEKKKHNTSSNQSSYIL